MFSHHLCNFYSLYYFVIVQALGLLELGTAIAVVVIEGHHAAVSSVSFIAAPAVVIVAGILSLLAGTFICYVTKCRPVTRASMKKWILVTVSFSSCTIAQ